MRRWTAGIIGLGALALLVLLFLPREDPRRSSLDGIEREPGPDEVDAATLVGRGAGDAAAGLPPPVDLDRVDRRLDLHGVVVRSDGAPVAGARLEVVAYPWREVSVPLVALHDLAMPGPSTLSAADGTFVLRLRPGEMVALRAFAAGFAPLELLGLQAGERVRVVLQAGVSLLVRTFGEDGRPVAAVPLRLMDFWSERTLLGVTDEAGACRFEDLVPGRDYVLLPLPEQRGSCGWTEVTLPSSGECVRDLVLPEGRTVTGEVVDADTGRPIADARVGVGFWLFQEVRTDGEGRYVLEGWTQRIFDDVEVLAPGYARGARRVGDLDVLDFALKPGFAVTGRILDPQGRPLAGARVAAVGSVQRGGCQHLSSDAARSADDGRFRLVDLSPDMPHTLVVAAAACGRTLLDFDPPAEGETSVDLGDVRLPRPLSIAGVVVEADGAPVPRVALLLMGANAQTSYGSSVERFTDDLGRFLFPDLAPGDYVLRASPEQGPEVERRVPLAGEDVADVRLVLASTRPFLVRVVTEDGTAVAGCDVSAYGSDGRGVTGTTDEGGEARLEVPFGPQRLMAHPRDRRDLLSSAPRVLGEDEDEATLVLPRALFVRGRVVDPEGGVVAGVTIAALRGGERAGVARTDAKGRFEIRVRAGAPVDVVYDGWSQYAQNNVGRAWDGHAGRVDGVACGSEDVELVVHPIQADRHVVVRVVDPEGRPVEGVAVVPLSHRTNERPLTDAEGRVRLEGLRPGTVDLWLHVEWTEERPWVAPRLSVPAEGQEVEVRLRPTSTVTGFVPRGKDGVAFQYVVMRLLREDGSMVCEHGVGRDDAFRLAFDRAERGPFRLTARARTRDGAYLEGSVEGVLPGARDVTVRLAPAAPR